eukprot:PhF_6_TR30423/c0_g1_i3/m.44634
MTRMMMMMNQSPQHHHTIHPVTMIKLRNRLKARMMNPMMVRTMTYKVKTKQLISWFRTMMNQSPQHHHTIHPVTMIKLRNRLKARMMNPMMVRTMTYKVKTKQLINMFRTIMNQSPQHHHTIPLVTTIKLRNKWILMNQLLKRAVTN